LEIILSVSGVEIVHRVGGHASGDPVLPAVDLVNDIAKDEAVPAGTFMTTGTYTGLNFVKPGDTVRVEFVGFGTSEVTFSP
jgi:2-keto-4-pentenoate hydratase/2-oxohepta-3-ene-1,7-dioic acid hydratase in catechol pathway